VRNEGECVCSVCLFRCNIFIGFRIIKEMPGLVGSGTPYIIGTEYSRSPATELFIIPAALKRYCKFSEVFYALLDFSVFGSV